ncbi:MAG: FAD binding domain-containing protein [Chloroflexota bacterium]|nr:FAD binding domain-containing protein [Chloroflexota bacterium]
MLNLREIHKPTTLADALKLLQQPDTIALAGGTELIAGQRRDVRAAVDLSALGLAYVRESKGAIAIGATTTLAALGESPILRALANGVIAQAAHRSAASVLRNQETLAGTLIVEPDSILAVALLALDAQATVVRKEARTVALADFLPMREHLLMMALLTEITVPMSNPRASLQTVARTPSDKPIVSVCAAARIDKTVAREVRIALGGVAETVVRAGDAEKELEGKSLSDSVIERAARAAADAMSPALSRAEGSPRGDFRSGVEYRKEMAIALTRRAVKELVS